MTAPAQPLDVQGSTGGPTAHYRTVGDIAVIELDHAPVNALAFELRSALVAGLNRAADDAAIRAVVVIGAHGVFCGGADLRQLDSPKYWAYPRTIELAQRLDEIGKPVVAAIGGLAMGGGLELALGCHYRLCLPASRLALPEVKLGLMPGGGGTLRLPRLIGVERALAMMLDGEPVDGETALHWGLVDALAQGALLDDAVHFARRRADALAESGSGPRRARDVAVDIASARAAFAATRAALAAAPNRGAAPMTILECTEAAILRPFDEAVALTGARTAERMASDEAKGHRYQFFAQREAAKVEGLPPAGQAAPVEIRRVTVVTDPGRPVPRSVERFIAGLTVAGVDARIAGADPAGSEADDGPADDGPAGRGTGTGTGTGAGLTVVVMNGAADAAAARLRAVDDALAPQSPIAIAGVEGRLTPCADLLRSARPLAGLRLPAVDGARIVEVVDVGAGSESTRAALARLLKRGGWLPVQTADGPRAVAAALRSALRDAIDRIERGGVTRSRIEGALRAWGVSGAALAVDPDQPAAAPAAAAADDDAALVEHCLGLLADEGRRLVASGQVLRASDIDVVLVADCGFPAFRGGPMFRSAQAPQDEAARGERATD